MVYGNTGDTSGSGVAFTRNPANGAKEFYGEFLINAQGEDVVAGVRTPEPVAELKKQMPKAYAELERIRQTLEKHFKDVQDFEFTIEDGVVYMLQTRNGKRTAMAALKFSMDMFKEKLVARQMGKVCVCGAAALEVDYQARTVKVDGKTFKEGDWLSIDGTAGKVFAGKVATAPSEIVAALVHNDAAAKQTEKFKSFQQL